jgi:hypothetical protein
MRAPATVLAISFATKTNAKPALLPNLLLFTFYFFLGFYGKNALMHLIQQNPKMIIE